MNGKFWLSLLVLLVVAAAAYSLGAQQSSSVVNPVAKQERKVLYYRNPMGLADTSPVPKKDAMGMDYVAVYDGEETASKAVVISADKVQKLGVKTEAAQFRELNKTVRAAGRIEIDEQRTFTIAPKFEGWVERLFVNSTGQFVSKGQPLFEVYSPELLSAQREYALAKAGLSSLKNADEETQKSMQRLVDASALRLKNWDVAETQTNQDRVIFRAPASGVVLEKKALQGSRFMAGEVLYQLADLSVVWLLADVNEQDLVAIKMGGAARVSLDAYPDKSFSGKVDFIYPTLNTATRTGTVRIALANPNGLLKPAMFAQVALPSAARGKVLSVPLSAVIDSGVRQVVLVQLAAGRFEPRAVKLGSRTEQFVEILAGVKDGESVVTSANFLIDAESNLKAALRGFGGAELSVAAIEQTVVESKPKSNSEVVTPKKKPAVVGHQAQGVLEALNRDGSVSITHQPIQSLGWPGMTMDFALANAALVSKIPVGSAIDFEIVERKTDDWVITKISLAHGAH